MAKTIDEAKSLPDAGLNAYAAGLAQPITTGEQVTRIAAAYVSHNAVAMGDLPNLISTIHGALTGVVTPAPVRKPAVSVKSSIKDDHIVCLEDGKRFKSLKRHLATLGLTPEKYRERWGLPADYPMVAPNYSETRSRLAKKMGLGRKRSRA